MAAAESRLGSNAVDVYLKECQTPERLDWLATWTSSWHCIRFYSFSVRPFVHPSGTRSDGSPLDINRRPTDTEWPPPSAIDRASTLYRHRGSVVREIESDRRTNGTRPSPVSSRPRSRTAWPSSDQQNASLHVTERQDGYIFRIRRGTHRNIRDRKRIAGTS